jgi:phage protein D
MEMSELSRHYGAFYAPAFAVYIGGEDVQRTLQVAVSQVEVDLALGAAGRFSMSVVDCYSIEKHAFISGLGADILGILKFGASVKICMGYGDIRGLSTMLTGTITEVGTTFPESGYPELTVSGYDRAFPLTLGKNSRNWSERTDSYAVEEIVRFHNLKGEIDTTREVQPLIEQNQEADLDFIRKLAEHNGFEFYVEGDKLRFGKPKGSGDGVVKLRWGEGLLSFKPEANLAGQVSEVEVHGWDPATKRPIVGRARAGDELDRDARRDSAAQLLQKGVHSPVLRLRQPVQSQAQADQLARAALNERATRFLTGEGESIGLPQIRPDTNITLGNLGTAFSRTYYVQQSTHRSDASGYRTRFKVKETTFREGAR